MPERTTSEQEFLLLELQYSLVQVQAQLAHLSVEERSRASEIVELLSIGEREYFARYARALHRSYPDSPSGESFESLRRATIALLGDLEPDWAPAIITIAREQVRGDRRRATDIANLRAGSEPRSI